MRRASSLRRLIAQGSTRRIDVGLLNGRRFTLMVSAGFDADVIHRVHARRQGNIRKSNYIQPILETLRTYRYPELRVAVDGESPPARGRLGRRRAKVSPGTLFGRLVIVANLPEYALGLPIAGMPPMATDSWICVYSNGRRDSKCFVTSITWHSGGTKSSTTSGSRVRAVRIDSELPVPLQCDGDPAGWTPADVSMLPGALTLLVPHAVNPAGGLSRELQ
jgi:diacylglycerol kinase (ATP)